MNPWAWLDKLNIPAWVLAAAGALWAYLRRDIRELRNDLERGVNDLRRDINGRSRKCNINQAVADDRYHRLYSAVTALAVATNNKDILALLGNDPPPAVL